MEDKNGVTQNPPSAITDAIASSPEVTEELQSQESQNPTAETQRETQEQETQQTEEPRVPYSRFKEVNEEKNWLKQQLETQLQRQPSQVQQPTQDPYAGMTAEEEKFFRVVDARAERIAEQKLRQISPVIDAGRMELAQLKVQQFRNTHPDVKPNSPEEMAIAERINLGYVPEDAYRVVMWDKKVGEAGIKAKEQIKKQVEIKKQANVENRSQPPGTGLPTSQKIPLRQRLSENYDKIARGEI